MTLIARRIAALGLRRAYVSWGAMPRRATKRGAERTAFARDCDILICGASFAGLAVARELAASGADVLVIDRYEIGERQTSACGIPTGWLHALELQESLAQTFSELVIHTPHVHVRYELPWTFSTFDYRTLCAALAAQGRFEFETAKVEGRSGSAVHTDRGDICAPLIVDGLGWRRVLGAGANIQPPDALLSRGLEVHPFGSGPDMEIWIDRSYVPAGYGWSFPAGGEVRIGAGSFDPRFHVREPTERLAGDLQADAVRYQGNWIPHALRDGTEDGVACGRELAAVYAGRQTREQALRRYHAFSAAHARPFTWMLRVQRLIPRVAPRVLAGSLKAMESRRFLHWAFGHYLEIAHPRFAGSALAGGRALSAVV
jgi:menaquinone-9 beta-reductase